MRKTSLARWQHLAALTFMAFFGASACSSNDDKGKKGGEGGIVYNPAADWTTLAYDTTSNYWNKAEKAITRENVKTLKEVWTFDLNSSPTCTPVVVKDRAYVLAQGVFAIDLKTGTQVWKNEDIAGAAPMAYRDGVLYAHDVAANVHAIDAATGKTLWSTPANKPFAAGFSAPVLAGDYVLVGGSSSEELLRAAGEDAVFRGYIAAYNIKDGSNAWTKYTVEPPSNGVGIWSTLSIDQEAGIIIAGTGNNYTGQASETSDAFLALPLSGTGDFLWQPQIWQGDVFTVRTIGNGNPDSDFGANPVLIDVGGKKLAVGGCKSGRVWSVDRTNGQVLKQRTLGNPNAFKGGVFNSGAWDGKHYLVVINGTESTGPGSEQADASERATLFALDPLTLDIAWERQVKGPAFSPITVANGVGFFGKGSTLQAFDTATGEVLFQWESEATINTAPVISNGRVFFGSGMPWIQTKPGTKVHALALPELAGTVSDAGVDDPDANSLAPTFANLYKYVITQGTCGGAACHNGQAAGFQIGSLDDTYAALVSKPATGPDCAGKNQTLVVPNDPQTSLLYLKLLDNPPCGARMPFASTTPLRADKVELVRRWIEAGAPKQ